jgi:hypothetical protein
VKHTERRSKIEARYRRQLTSLIEVALWPSITLHASEYGKLLVCERHSEYGAEQIKTANACKRGTVSDLSSTMYPRAKVSIWFHQIQPFQCQLAID